MREHTTAVAFLDWATLAALTIFSVAFLLMVVRIVRGPTLPDRIIALDMLVAAVVGFIATVAIRTGFSLYIDVAISLALVGFLSTVAFARFVLVRGRSHEAGDLPLPQADRPAGDAGPAQG